MKLKWSKLFPIYTEVRPVCIGMNLTILKQLTVHDGIQQMLVANMKNVEQLYLKVTHNNRENIQVIDQFARTASHQWWEMFLGWPTTASGIWNMALHPIVIVLIGQICLSLSIIGIFVYLWRL